MSIAVEGWRWRGSRPLYLRHAICCYIWPACHGRVAYNGRSEQCVCTYVFDHAHVHCLAVSPLPLQHMDAFEFASPHAGLATSGDDSHAPS